MSNITLPTTKFNNTFSSFEISGQTPKQQQSNFTLGNNTDTFEKNNKKQVVDIEKLIKNDKTYAPLGAVPGLALYLAGYIREWRSKTPKNINYRMMNAGAALSVLGLFGVMIKEYLQKTKKYNDKNLVYPEITKKQKKYYKDKNSQKCNLRALIDGVPLFLTITADIVFLHHKNLIKVIN